MITLPEIDSEKSLEEAILLLENQQKEEARMTREAFNELYESVKPMNLLRNSIEEANNDEGTGNTLHAALGMGAGFLARRLFTGGTPNMARKLLGTAVQFGVMNLITKNTKVKDSITNFLSRLTGVEEDKGRR